MPLAHGCCDRTRCPTFNAFAHTNVQVSTQVPAANCCATADHAMADQRPHRGTTGTLLLGVMTDPVHVAWRSLMRLRMESAPRSIRFAFVLGDLSACPASVRASLGCGTSESAARPLEQCTALRDEHARHSDLVHVPMARECTAPGQPVAEKTLAWYRLASHSLQRNGWIGKIDDDTFPNMRVLGLDLAAVHDQRQFAFYGRLRWRLWSRALSQACGPFVDAPASIEPWSRRAYQTLASYASTSTTPSSSATTTSDLCASGHDEPIGPFLYADGSYHMMTAALARSAFPLGARHMLRSPRANSSAWNHEDVGIGYLIHTHAHSRHLPVAYYALQSRHIHRFPTSPRRTTPPSLDTDLDAIRRRVWHPNSGPRHPCAVLAHNVRTAIHLDQAATAFSHSAASITSKEAFNCFDCSEWGWSTEALRANADYLPPTHTISTRSSEGGDQSTNGLTFGGLPPHATCCQKAPDVDLANMSSTGCCLDTRPEGYFAGRCKVFAAQGACSTNPWYVRNCIVACGVCSICPGHPASSAYARLYSARRVHGRGL